MGQPPARNQNIFFLKKKKAERSEAEKYAKYFVLIKEQISTLNKQFSTLKGTVHSSNI